MACYVRTDMTAIVKRGVMAFAMYVYYSTSIDLHTKREIKCMLHQNAKPSATKTGVIDIIQT